MLPNVVAGIRQAVHYVVCGCVIAWCAGGPGSVVVIGDALQDAFVALRHHLTLDASEPVRRGNTAHVLSTPRAMAARFEGHAAAVEESGELAARLTFDLTSDLGYRYPGRTSAEPSG